MLVMCWCHITGGRWISFQQRKSAGRPVANNISWKYWLNFSHHHSLSVMKFEMCFPLECHQSTKVRTAVMKRVGARFGLALVPILQQWELFIHTYIHLSNRYWQSAAQLHCLSRWQCYKYTSKITAEKNDWIAIALITLHRNVKVNYSKSIQDFLRSKQHRQLLNSKKAIFEIRRLTDILFG